MEILKLIHVLAAVISISGFIVRGILMIQESELLRRRWVKTIPHINDTVLLASAVTMAVKMQQYPGVADWLTAKVIALLLYIGLGMVALRFGKTKQIRVIAWVAAIDIFIYIVAVAITKNPLVLF